MNYFVFEKKILFAFLKNFGKYSLNMKNAIFPANKNMQLKDKTLAGELLPNEFCYQENV